jgi:metallo-beta-lactamase class B
LWNILSNLPARFASGGRRSYTGDWSFSVPKFTHLDRRSVLASLAACLAADVAFPVAARAKTNPDWTTPMTPFLIAQSLYYVGSRDLASYLLTTSQGLILINSNLVTSPPQIKASIEKLGFHYSDVKIMLISHGHYDHCAGSVQIQKETGAQYMVMDADISVVESGGKTDFHYGHDASMQFPPTKVDRKLFDTDQVRLGDTVLTAHKTAGHTKGCTTWTMVAQEGGKSYNVVIVGSPNVNPGYNLIDNPKYPQIADDYAQGFRTLKALPCDIFLGAHGGYFDMLTKYARMQAGDANPFIDSKGYKAYVAERQRAFESELARQQNARPS